MATSIDSYTGRNWTDRLSAFASLYSVEGTDTKRGKDDQPIQFLPGTTVISRPWHGSGISCRNHSLVSGSQCRDCSNKKTSALTPCNLGRIQASIGQHISQTQAGRLDLIKGHHNVD